MRQPHGKIGLALRRCAPEPIKRLLRLARLALTAPPPPAPELPQELLRSCQFLSSRYRMLELIPRGGVAAELGVLDGDFSREILSRCRPVELHLVDVDTSRLAADVRQHPSARVHRGLTGEILSAFRDETFDFIYVDADHSYAAVRADIHHSAPKLKPGGIMGFNDFGRIVRPGFGVFGVHQAVSEFIVESRWPVLYFCFNGEALYDIALKKPDR